MPVQPLMCCKSLSLTTNQREYGKAFFAKLFCASKKATVSRAFAKRAPFLLLLSGTKEVNIKNEECTSQQILDTNHKKIYNKKLSVSQISVRNATCDIELASDSLTNKLDAVH